MRTVSAKNRGVFVCRFLIVFDRHTHLPGFTIFYPRVCAAHGGDEIAGASLLSDALRESRNQRITAKDSGEGELGGGQGAD